MSLSFMASAVALPRVVNGHDLENEVFWELYRNEIVRYDKTMVAHWQRTLDGLLLFSTLFSFILATVTRASRMQLLNDSLHDLAPSWLYRAVSALWLTGLFISLPTAFLAILARQWLYAYERSVLRTTKPFIHWARKREYLLAGLTAWRLPAFITLALPLLLHTSLVLFLIGLALLTWNLDRVIASWVTALTGTLLLTSFVGRMAVTRVGTRSVSKVIRRLQGPIGRRSALFHLKTGASNAIVLDAIRSDVRHHKISWSLQGLELATEERSPSDPFLSRLVHSDAPTAKLLTAAIENRLDAAPTPVALGTAVNQSVSQTAIQLVQCGGSLPPEWLLRLLLLVDFAVLSSAEIAVLSSQCISALHCAVLAEQHSSHECGTPCIALFIAQVATDLPRIDRGLVAGGLVRILASIVGKNGWQQHVRVVPETTALVEFVLSAVQSPTPMQGGRDAILTYIVDGSALWCGGDAYVQALEQVLSDAGTIINQAMLKGVARRISGTLHGLLQKEKDKEESWFLNPKTWELVLRTVLGVIRGSTFETFPSEILQVAGPLAAVMSMLRRIGWDISEISLQFVPQIQGLLSAPTVSPCHDVRHLAQHYRELVPDWSVAGPALDPDFQALLRVAEPCAWCPVWPSRTTPWAVGG